MHLIGNDRQYLNNLLGKEKVLANILINVAKLTEYPFAYSFTAIVLTFAGQSIDWYNFDIVDIAPTMTLIVVLATVLSISDPFGSIIRKIINFEQPLPEMNRAKQIIKKFKNTNREGTGESEFEKYYHSLVDKATRTTLISYEIDKIVAIFYFIIILSLILLVLITNFQMFFQ